MVCYHPLEAFISRGKNSDTGKKIIIFNPLKAHDADPIKLPCGQCVGCRLERSRQWGVRCLHESQMHKDNCFITLTFSPDELEKRKNPHTVDVRDWQLFMKRLKKYYKGKKIRFYHCGEYGETNGRPHYHACLFGHDFEDKELWRVNNGVRLYTSEILNKIWGKGYCVIGDVTFESACYVARYIMKKVNGDMQEDHYTDYDEDTGEILVERKPEYTTMSRRPGIGKDWYDKYKDDVYPHDNVVVNGVLCKPPRYYDGLLESDRPYEFDDIKFNRLTNAEKHEDNNTPERLIVREEVQEARLKQLPRDI